jgi:hypothetical protein
MSPAYLEVDAAPCPFCASERLTLAEQAAWYYVSCENCNANGPESNFRQIAITLWNERKQPRPLVYPDGWKCKYPRSVGSIAQDCEYPNCDCKS